MSKFPKCRGVGIMLMSGDNVAVSTRLSGSRNYAGFDQFPGGAIDPGETPEEAASRELCEETGLSIHPMSMKPLVEGITLSKPCGKMFVGSMYYLNVSHYVASQIRNPEPDKHTDWRWIPLDQLQTLNLVSWQRQYLRAFRMGLGNVRLYRATWYFSDLQDVLKRQVL